jgi:hypothetical protein
MAERHVVRSWALAERRGHHRDAHAERRAAQWLARAVGSPRCWGELRACLGLVKALAA